MYTRDFTIRFNMMRPIFIILFFSFLRITPASAQTLPPCAERPSYLNNPWVNARFFCLELLLEDTRAGELAFTALAAAPDGTLYAARPLAGEVLAIVDTNADSLPDTAHVVASNLTLPNALEFYDGKLYIAAASNIVVYDLDTGQTSILIDDIPTGAGFWTGDLTISADERIYISTGGGDILSYVLDGTDRQIFATGLPEPVGLAFQGNTLYGAGVDELKQIAPDGVITTALTFPAGSQPSMLTPYTNDLLPSLTNSLLVILRGTPDHLDVPGFALAAIHPDTGYTVLIPAESDSAHKQNFTLKEMNYRMSGFWPHQPLGVAVSPEGWVYVSVGGGRIYALRPA